MSRRSRPARKPDTRGDRPRPEIPAAAPSRDRRVLLAAALLVIAGLAAWATSFRGVFLFDDHLWILNDPQVRDLGATLADPFRSRPMLRLSIALNHAFGGTDPGGYHLVNLAGHLVAGLLLLGIVRRTLAGAGRGPESTWIATAVAVLWTVHPLQTESVTYVVQRSESLMGMLYLLTLYCVIRGAGSPRARAWHAGAIAACAIGMGFKAVMITAPFVVLLYDRIFLTPSWREIARTRWPLYAGLLATIGVLAATGVLGGVIGTTTAARRSATVGFALQTVSGWEYLRSQPGVLLHYLRLTAWPAGQCLDLRWRVAHSASTIVGPALLVGGLGVATLVLLWKRPRLGFIGAWFFAILAPTSSFVPVQDLAVEHRMYLPLAAVIAAVVLAADGLLRRFVAPPARGAAALAAVAAATVALGVATTARNAVYESEERAWRDVVAKRPLNTRAYQNLGQILGAQGEVDEAMDCFRRSLEINPNQHRVRFNLAYYLSARGRHDEALAHLRTAVAQSPRFFRARFNLGNALFQRGDYEAAIEQYRVAAEITPRNVQPLIMIGNARSNQGRLDEAEQAFRAAVARPDAAPADRAKASTNLGNTLIGLRRTGEALAAYRAATEIDATYVTGWHRRAWLSAQAGELDEAVDAYETVLRLKPDHAEARQELEALRARGRP
ncbi:MAG: tetratricopeptide repeat protein [Planctomycetota bacterium]|jgi:tetratricopeptide (TPR) repeat protein